MKTKQTIILSVLALALVLPFVISPQASAATCGGVETSILNCGNLKGDDAVMWILKLVISIMTFGVGILAVVGIVIASILYASAGGAPEQVKKAKTIILNVVIGLILYAFMFAITNFLIPGGVFGQASTTSLAAVDISLS